jgi:phosphoacetylglucosamine mutase
LLAHASQDNGVKLVDPRGEMLENSWEIHATRLANASSTSQLIEVIGDICQRHNINVQKPGRVVYARDTRPSGPALVAALEDGLKAMSAESRNEGVKTTPILHYLVRCINTKGTAEEYGQDTEDGYYQKLSSAFLQLVVSAELFLSSWPHHFLSLTNVQRHPYLSTVRME